MKLLDKIDDHILNNYMSDLWHDRVKLMREIGIKSAARELGINHRNMIRAMNNAVNKASDDGYIIDMPTMIIANNKKLGKMTTQADAQGNIKQIWYRQSDFDIDAITDAIKNACIDLPQVLPKKPKGLVAYNKDVIPFFNIGDGHIGMLSYRKEVGQDFDIDIAVRDLWSAMSILIDESPDCERCVIQDMGDMTHYENEQQTTEASGHALDCDGRYTKMINAYVDTMLFIINKALEKFKFVDVIINQGNHSRKNDKWMNIFLRHTYANEGRVNILSNESVYIPYRMGNTFVMCHHSDKCRPLKLAQVMATDYRHDFGEALYKYIDIGHIHHNMVLKEHPAVTIESFNQLATADKYAHDGGWRSRSCLTVVFRSKTYGEVGRHTLPLERVRDIIENVKAGTNSNKRTEVYSV